ncbi:MAG: molecular chaperone GrpE [Solirubrobacteraceae bacterium]|nr:molecular chaperone GrpE [Solirubrobacteraceae bacterium]
MTETPSDTRHDDAVPAEPDPGSAAERLGEPAAPADGAGELARMEDRYKRAVADLDNYRKRSSADVQRRIDAGREAFLREWLEPVDTLERALRMMAGQPGADSLRAVLDQIEAILARQGVMRIGSPGDPFDPERHEAIDVRMTDDVPDRTVLDVARSGYALGDRVLRPAQVVVARRPQPPG